MAKSNELHRKTNSRFHNKNNLSSRRSKVSKDVHNLDRARKPKLTLSEKKKEWESAVCPICLESPHNAVLLLCSSHEKNCRAYMCATDPRLSNCLDQFKKGHSLLLCPLCRGEVKGWAVVEPARRYLDLKKRACVLENCSFVGTYREIKKHVKMEHPFACPREVDTTHMDEWKMFELRRDFSNLLSMFRSLFGEFGPFA